MAEKELRPRSFRIDEETAEKFKEIAQKIGGNQQETLSRLIESYELQAGKEVLTDHKAEVEDFERYMMAATRMYMDSLEANQLMAISVRAEFDAQLKSKDAVILDIQDRLATSEEKQKETEATAAALLSESTRLKESIVALEKEIAEKDRLNESLSELCHQLKSQLMNTQDSANRSSKLAEEVAKLKQELATEQQEKEMIILQNQKAILDLQTQHLEQISTYQEKYKQLLEQLEEK